MAVDSFGNLPSVALSANCVLCCSTRTDCFLVRVTDGAWLTRGEVVLV